MTCAAANSSRPNPPMMISPASANVCTCGCAVSTYHSLTHSAATYIVHFKLPEHVAGVCRDDAEANDQYAPSAHTSRPYQPASPDPDNTHTRITDNIRDQPDGVEDRRQTEDAKGYSFRNHDHSRLPARTGKDQHQ